MKLPISLFHTLVYVACVVMAVILIYIFFFDNTNMQEAEYHYEQGRRFLESEEYLLAESRFTEALEVAPRFAMAYAGRCTARYHNDRAESGLTDCNRALELDNSLETVYFDRCLIYSALGQYQNAIQDCEQALVTQPENANIYNN